MRQLKRQADGVQADRMRSRGRSVDSDRVPVGSEAVARELDELNANYQKLLDMLYERLRRIAAANPGDIVTLVSDFFFLGYVSCLFCLWLFLLITFFQYLRKYHAR